MTSSPWTMTDLHFYSVVQVSLTPGHKGRVGRVASGDLTFAGVRPGSDPFPHEQIVRKIREIIFIESRDCRMPKFVLDCQRHLALEEKFLTNLDRS